MNLASGIDIIEIQRVREAIQRYGQRFLDRIYTPQELAQGIIQALQSIDSGIEFSKDAHKFAQKFSINASASAYESLYEKALAFSIASNSTNASISM